MASLPLERAPQAQPTHLACQGPSAEPEQILVQLQTLEREREKLLGFKATEERKIQELLEGTEVERRKIMSEFEQLRKFLEEQERLLLAQLQKLDEDIVRLQTDAVRKLSTQISWLSEQIRELEGKCQQPTSEFLQVGRSTTDRCEKGMCPQQEDACPELEIRLGYWGQQTRALKETMRKVKDWLPSELEKVWGASLAESVKRTHKKATVTLDPDTAHSQLILSEDGKCVRRGHTWQDLPTSPERFESRACVLGCEGFSSGQHYWEVEVRVGDRWAVGVAKESVQRKDWIRHVPGEGIWAVECDGDQYQALTFPLTPLPLPRAPERIRVSLNCTGGTVAFFDAANEAPIFTFPPASFNGERLRPWLWLWGKGCQLRMCS